jgi:hypothetical protein
MMSIARLLTTDFNINLVGFAAVILSRSVVVVACVIVVESDFVAVIPSD